VNRTDSELGTVLRYNIGRILLERGERPSDLYRRLGWHRNTYASIFKGQCGPKMGTLDAIAKALEVTLDELLRPRKVARVVKP